MNLDRRVAASIDPLDTYRAPLTQGLGMAAAILMLVYLAGVYFGGRSGFQNPYYHLALVVGGLVLAVPTYRWVTRIRMAMTDEYLVVGKQMYRWKDIVRVDERSIVVKASARSGGGEVDSYYLHEITVVENGKTLRVKLPRIDGSDGFRMFLAKNISEQAFESSHFADWIDRV